MNTRWKKNARWRTQYNNNSHSSLFLSAHNLFVSHTCILFCTELRCSNTQLVTRLIDYNWHSFAVSCPFIVQQDQWNERSWTRRFAFSASKELYRHRLYMCILTLVFPSCLLLLVLVFDVFISVYLCTHCRSLTLRLRYSSLSYSYWCNCWLTYK